MLDMLIFARGRRPKVQTLIDRMLGTPIGNMTNGTGLVTAFNGVISENTGGSATKLGANTAYVGKDWGAGNAKTVTGFKVWGTNDFGYDSVSGAGTNITITLQGSTDNFSSSIVDLGSVGPTADNNSSPLMEKMDGLDTSTAYRFHRLKIQTTASASGNLFCAECQFYEDL